MTPLTLHPDRLFSSDPAQRDLARGLYATVKDLPIVSPHGHTDPQWYADDEPFSNASALFITPDHYVFRMLYSQGVALEDLAIPRKDGGPVQTDARKIWRTFAAHYHLFRGTPTRVWLDHAFTRLSASGSVCRQNPPTGSSIRSTAASRSRSSVRGHCSNASTSKSSQRLSNDVRLRHRRLRESCSLARSRER
jgi:hypothetical protein